LTSSTDSSPDNPCSPETSGGGCVHFVYDIASSPPTVCVYATTSIQGHLVDRAPNFSDTSCPASSPSVSRGLNGGVGAGGTFG
jgi:hypothetical protein